MFRKISLCAILLFLCALTKTYAWMDSGFVFTGNNTSSIEAGSTGNWSLPSAVEIQDNNVASIPEVVITNFASYYGTDHKSYGAELSPSIDINNYQSVTLDIHVQEGIGPRKITFQLIHEKELSEPQGQSKVYWVDEGNNTLTIPVSEFDSSVGTEAITNIAVHYGQYAWNNQWLNKDNYGGVTVNSVTFNPKTSQ